MRKKFVIEHFDMENEIRYVYRYDSLIDATISYNEICLNDKGILDNVVLSNYETNEVILSS